LKDLELRIHYTFTDKKLLERALTHSSYANEHRGQGDNERLEFLGDAVLELSSSHYLYTHFPDKAEGALSKLRSSLVCEASLAACARKLMLGECLRLGRGEDKNGGSRRDSILSDALEALIGAVYLDSGFENADRFITRFVMDEMIAEPAYFDAKTQLQEVLQQGGEIQILYREINEEGPGHEKVFTVQVEADGQVLGSGSGPSKKQAEQAAALMALTSLKASGSKE